MYFLTIFFIFVLGLIVGSFLNVVIFRLKNGGKIFLDRSRCPHCKKELNVIDLIPLLSFMVFRAKCRYCKREISWQYPLVELATAIIFVSVFLKQDLLKSNFPHFALLNSPFSFFFFAFILSVLIVIFVYDLKYYLIPDAVIFLGITAVLIVLVLYFFGTHNLLFLDNLLGALIYSGFFFVQYFISSGKWVGGGDIKLGLLLGLILGWKLTIVSLFMAYFTGAIIAVILIILKKKTKKDILPFGPFLIASFVFSLFYGNFILDLYLKYLLG